MNDTSTQDPMDIEQTSRKPRLGLVVIILVVTAFGIVFLAMSDSGVDEDERLNSSASVAQPAPLEQLGVGEERRNSANYQRQVEQERRLREQQGLGDAAASLPPVETNSELSQPITDEQAAPPIDISAFEQTQPQVSVPQASSYRLNSSRSSNESNPFLQAAIGGWAPRRPATVVVTRNNTTPTAAPASVQTSQVKQTTSPQSTAQAGTPIVGAGELMLGLSKSGGNSDVGGPIIASLVGMEFGENTLIGSFERKGNYLDIRFSSIQISATGRTIPINAIAVNLETMTPGVRSSYNSRWAQRYGLPFLSAFIGGFGQAVQQGTTTTTIVDGQTQVVDERNFDLEDQLIIGAGAAGQQLSGDFAEAARGVQPLVKIKVNEPIGILFLESLYLNTSQEAVNDQ